MKHLLKQIVFASLLLFVSSSAAAQPPWLSKTLSNADARHLISRTGFGVSANQLKALRGLSRAQAIDFIIQGFRSTPELPMPAWTDEPAPLFWTRQDLSPEERRRFDRERDSEFIELRQWWVNNLLATNSPQSERMVLFWHDHFATSYHSIDRQSIALARQNQTFRQQGMEDFKKLVKAMIRDPALLNYLDNISNRKAAPNENLARELLELFTLGEGNYDEHTVREAARSLTGYNVSQNKNLSFEFQSWSHDNGRKTLFGQSADFDGDDLVDRLFQQPALARFIATKFWHAFIADQPPSSDKAGHNPVEQLARHFKQNDFNITSLYRATLESKEFWSDEFRAGLVKSPAQLIVGFARSMEYPKKINQQIPSLLARSGMDLFAPPNVSGWNEGDAWITTGRLLNRYNAIDNLAISGSDTTADIGNMNSMSMIATENTMTGNGNPMNNTMPTPAYSTPTSSTNESRLKVLLAAEDYHGPVNYKVDLIDAADNELWNSGRQELAGGHDTRKYGRLRIPEDLAWQTVNFDIPKTTLAEAALLRVHYLNDSAGEDGDRNMYVDGISLDRQWLDSSLGRQTSNCPPGALADAGNLYCAGNISLPLEQTRLPSVQPSLVTPQASSVHIHWVRWKEKTDKLDLTLTLQNLHTDSRTSPVFSFHLKSKNGGEPTLELNSFGCWPECVSQWPDCSWTDPDSPDRKSMVFPMSGAAANKNLKCHYDSLTQTEEKLVYSLMASAPSLLKEAVSSHRPIRPEKRQAIAQWQKLFKKYHSKLSSGQYDSASAPQITINRKMKINKPERWLAQHIPATASSLAEHGDNLIRDGITLSQLLLPGLSETRFKGLDQLQEKPIAVQLEALINHPAFQLH